MSDIVTTDPVSPEAVEHILGTGDLSKLTTHQRVEYYAAVCKSVGLNPLTRPFRFMSFQGQTVMYATRDCTDQLRQIRKISIAITDKRLDGDLFIVTAQATAADGRRDEDVGAVTIGKLMGEARANATMKAMTKAKRRVTLSICGLGMLSEDEVETLPGAVTYDHEAPSPAPLRAAAAPTPRGERKVAPEDFNPGDTPHDRWMALLRAAMAKTTSREEAEAIGERDSVKDYMAKATDVQRRDIAAVLANGYGRHVTPATRETPDDLHIEGEKYAAAG
jgi:hypothetical protein